MRRSRRELARYDAPDLYPFAVGLAIVGPTVLVHGSDDQKARWLPHILDGSEIWCQLFSEPDAGSDLAGLRSRAVRDGERWTVTGQKTWSSRAHYAAWGLLLARSDPPVPKHAGITAFGLPMGQPGVEVRPLRQVNGDLHFNEVFMEDAAVDDHDRIAAEGEGWAVARTSLGFERGGHGRHQRERAPAWSGASSSSTTSGRTAPPPTPSPGSGSPGCSPTSRWPAGPAPGPEPA